jgi:hypothetical protein
MLAASPVLLLALVVALLALTVVASGADALIVRARQWPNEEMRPFATRTIEQLEGFTPSEPAALDDFGGLADRRLEGTGFFRAARVDGRWWLVDPAGGLYHNRALCGVAPGGSPNAKTNFAARFGSVDAWRDETIAMLRRRGFNGLGAWSAVEQLRSSPRPMPYVRIWKFMGAYGKESNRVHPVPGHLGFPNDCIFVFEPEFEAFCDRYAEQLAKDKDDPYLIGHFSDNELPFPRKALDKFLSLTPESAGYRAALAWLESRHPGEEGPFAISDADRDEFLGVVVDRYMGIVARAIRKHDPNHLYLGSRFYSEEKHSPAAFRAAARHCDVISVNIYGNWTPDAGMLALWRAQADKPFLVTEFYARGMDSGLPNTTGAGWVVATQRERGLFYQNFCLGLLEDPQCVGWQLFQYQDNDPENASAELSNRTSNKGIVDLHFAEWAPYLDEVQRLNRSAYSLIGWFDAHSAGGRQK